MTYSRTILVLIVSLHMTGCDDTESSCTPIETPKFSTPNDYLSRMGSAAINADAEGRFTELTKPEQVYVCVSWVEAEVNNGGFDQFFYNSAGNHALETVEALDLIGANHTAEIVRRANGRFGESGPSQVRIERQAQLEKITGNSEGAFDDLDEAFYEYKDDLGALLKAYVKANEKEFTTREE